MQFRWREKTYTQSKSLNRFKQKSQTNDCLQLSLLAVSLPIFVEIRSLYVVRHIGEVYISVLFIYITSLENKDTSVFHTRAVRFVVSQTIQDSAIVTMEGE